MAQCNFSLSFSMTPDEVASKAREAILGGGGGFDGDANAGEFDVSTPLGSIRGSYIIHAGVITVTITSKPFLVSCGLIEKQLKGYFTNA